MQRPLSSCRGTFTPSITTTFAQYIIRYSSLLAAASARPLGAAVEEACAPSDGGGVSCGAAHLQPVMKRSRGISACVCVEGPGAAAAEADEFVYVRYSNCSEGGGTCWAGGEEVGL